MTRGGLCVKLKDFHDHHGQSGSADVSAAPRRSQGLQAVRAHHLGRSDFRDRQAAGARSSPSTAPRRSCPKAISATWGSCRASTRGDPFFNRLGSTVNEKTFCTSGSSTAWLLTRRPDRRRRPRELRPFASTSSSGPAIRSPPTCITGRSCSRHKSAAPKSSSSTPISRAPQRPATGTSVRSRARMARWRMGIINSIIEQGLVDQDYVENHTLRLRELKARAADFTPEYVEKVTGVKAGRHPQVRPRVRNRTAVRDPHRRRHRALGRRRTGDPRRLCAARARRLMAPCRRRHSAIAAVGFPHRLGEGGAARLDQARARGSSTTCASARR